MAELKLDGRFHPLVFIWGVKGGYEVTTQKIHVEEPLQKQTAYLVDVVTFDPLIAQLKIKKTGWHRYFVQLHKAKGGIFFKMYATILAIALLCLFITGFIMAW